MNHPNRTVAPAVADICDLHLAPSRSITLPNGIALTIINQGDQPVSRLTLLWEGGQLDFSQRELPAIMMESLREGAEGLTGEQIEDLIDFNGAILSRYPAIHHTGLTLVSLNHRLPQLLEMMRQIIFRPTFDEVAISRQKAKTAANLRVSLSKVSYVANQAATRLICGASHPEAAHNSPEAVEAITRQQIVDTHQQIINHGRLCAFLAGQIDAQTEANVVDFLSSFPTVAPESIIRVQPYCAEAPQRVDITMPQAVQSAITMCIPAIDRLHPDYINLRLAVMALGGYFGSRLMQNIREDLGLTYGIAAALHGSPEGGYIRIAAQCDHSYIDQVIEQTKLEMQKLADQPIDADELTRLRRYAWSNLATTADSPFTTADYYITSRLVGTPPGYFADQLAAIRHLTPATIQSMARTYFTTASLRTATAGSA